MADFTTYGVVALEALYVRRAADEDLCERLGRFEYCYVLALRQMGKSSMDAFLDRLRGAFGKPERIVDQAHAWTSGHPYMLQNVLKEAVAARDKEAGDPSLDLDAATAFIAGIVERRFFGQEEDAVLGVVRRTFEGQGLAPETMDALNHYRVLLADKDVPVAQGAKREVQEKLRITGLVAFVTEGKRTLLRVRNRIFRQRYDAAWAAGLLDRPIYEAMAARWLQEGEDEDFLLRGRELDAAEVWVKAQEKAVSGWTAEFVNASRRIGVRGTKRETTLWRRMLVVALAVVGMCTSLVVLAYVQRSEAARQSLETQVAVLRAQKDANDVSVLQYKKEIESLNADRDRLDGLVSAGNSSLDKLQAERVAIEKKMKMATSSEQEKKFLASLLRTNESRTVQVADELDRAKRALDASSRRSTDLTGEIAELQKKNLVAQEDLRQARKATSDLNTQMESLRSQVTQLSTKIGDVQSRYATCTDELAKVRGEKDSALGAKAKCEANAAAAPP